MEKSPTAQSEGAEEQQKRRGGQPARLLDVQVSRKRVVSFRKSNSTRMLLRSSGSDYAAQIDEGKVDGIRKAKEKVIIHRKIFIFAAHILCQALSLHKRVEQIVCYKTSLMPQE